MKSPIFNMLRLLSKFDLLEEMNDFIRQSKFVQKNIWSQKVKENIYCHEKIRLEKALHSRLSLARYITVRSGQDHRLWRLALERPWNFKNIATLIRLSATPIQSRECVCGTVAHDIIKHVFMSCQKNLQDRNTLFEKICDILDVNIFVSIWAYDDMFLSFLLGGIPDHCNDVLDFNTWAEIMILVSHTTKKWYNILKRCT